MAEAKVLVASPTYDGMRYCKEKFLARMKELTYPNHDILIVDNSENNDFFDELNKESGMILMKDYCKEKKGILRIISSRNMIIDYALKNNYDYILMMDFDVIPPKNVIEALLVCGKDIVSGLYSTYFMTDGKLKVLPVAFMPLTVEEFEEVRQKSKLPESVKSHLDLRRHMLPEEMESGKLLEVLYPSAGCMLISRKVFENEKVRYGLLDVDAITSDDIYFITKAREAGFQSFCFTRVKCSHLVSGKYKKNSEGNLEHPAY